MVGREVRPEEAPTVVRSDNLIGGVTYNLDEMQLKIKPERKMEIDSILGSGLLDPGTAGKLKGMRQTDVRRVAALGQSGQSLLESDV